MKRLSGLDTAFLTSETKQWPAHVACITIFDPAEIAGGFSIDVLKRSFASRLNQLPPLRWRVIESQLGLTAPHWIEDPEFDLDWHIRRMPVPSPGGREDLASTAEDIYRHRLDRRRPLWELWVLDGLAEGHVALLWKIHHACIDGMAGAGMQEMMFDSDPDWRPPDVIEDDGWRSEKFPSAAAIALSSLPAIARSHVRASKDMVSMIPRLPHVIRSTGAAMPQAVPRTRFNGPVGQKRAWSYTTVSLSEMKTVKNAFGVKLNDVYVAMISGALKRYLTDRDELPTDSLVASIPVSARPDGSGGTGNMISGMTASLATDLDDPGARLKAIHESTSASKEMQEAMGVDMMMSLADVPPPAMMALAARFYGKTQLVKRIPPMFNVVISNVPGPREPLYNQGAPIKAFQSMGIVYDGAGLFIGAMSYMDQMDIGILSSADMLDKPFELADDIAEELQALLAVAGEA
ncbi:MAG: wax ester/triacylglycerol synthase family O-acyltransferase [Acidimicrobiales bacterium]